MAPLRATSWYERNDQQMRIIFLHSNKIEINVYVTEWGWVLQKFKMAPLKFDLA